MKDRYTDIHEYIHDLQEAIEKDPKCAIHHYNLGVAMLSLGDYTEAEDCFLNAIRHSAHMAEAYVQLGGLCLRRGDLDGCMQYNKEAAECRAKFPVAWSNIGFVHLQRGEVDEAISALHKALTWDPKYLQARATFASALGNLDIAIDMGGHKISAKTGFKISGGTFSLKNGTLETIQGRSQIYNGCEATISNVVMNMKGEIWVGSTNSDQSSYQSSDTLKLVDVTMNTSAVSKSDKTAGCVIAMKNSKIIVERGTFTNTEGVAFATSGDANTTGQDWSFSNAVFNVSVATNDCIGVAIQCHNSGTWKIEGCTFNMDNGVALSVRGGNVTVTDCTYNYTNSSGSSQSGQLQGTSVDSIVVQVPNAIATWYSEGSYGYGENSSLSVDGVEQSVTADSTVRYVGF